jgi:hypothetical protein
MELIFRTIYHNILQCIFLRTGLKNSTAYIYNIKRIESILKDDYRNIVCTEVSSESEDSCSVVSDDVQSSEYIERTDDFEFPDQDETNGSETDSSTKSDANSGDRSE